MKKLFVAILYVLAFSFAHIVSAQTTEIDYELWLKQSQHVERQLENDDVSESLRKQVADWRVLFQSASEANKTPIATVLSQIEALGPLPEDGTEDPLADRRKELSEELSRLKAPAAKALEAFKKADGLIREIDQEIRAEQASALVHLGKSPLYFLAWPAAFRDIHNFHSALLREVTRTFSTESSVKVLSNQWVNLAVRVFISLVLLLGAQAIIRWILGVFGRSSGDVTRLARFATSFLVMLMRVAGLSYLVLTLNQSGVFEVRGTLVLTSAFSGTFQSILMNWPLWVFGSIWLGQRLLLGPQASLRVENTAAAKRGVLLFGVLGLVMVIAQYFRVISAYENLSEQTLSILNFVLILIGSFALLQLSKVGMELPKADFKQSGASDQGQVSGNGRLIVPLKKLSNFVAIAAPLLAAIGFANASAALFYPFIQTLALLAFIYLLQVLVNDIYLAITYKGTEPSEDALLPILIGFFLILLALPVFALIWGARSVDLIEIWNAFQKGVPIGDARLSPVNLLSFVIVFTVGYMATRLLQSALKGAVLPKTSIETGAQTAIVSGVGYLGIFFAAVVAISSAGLDLSSLAIVAGALSVGIGFGLQNIVSNFVSGIILLIERPVSEGDWIEVGGKMGYVRDISVRSTRIETFDRSDVIVPNADLVSGVVTNYTRGNTLGRLIVPVGVAYGVDTRRVAEILSDIINDQPLVLLNPPPSVVFQGFGADSLDFEIRAILRDVNFLLSVKSEVNHQIATKFKEEGIEIPFAQRDIWIRNPEALKGPEKT